MATMKNKTLPPKPKPDFSKYSEVVASGLIRPKKACYTARDVKAAIVDSLFTCTETLTVTEATRLIMVSAAFHDTTWSDGVSRMRRKAMFSIGL